jgi:aldose 1-epimerase
MTGGSSSLGEASRLSAGDLEAVFLPTRGMLGASLKHRGVELLRRVDDLEGAAASGSAAGIPLLHPWANRLGDSTYRAAGKEVRLDPASSLWHRDENGLPMHGVPWSRLSWQVVEAGAERLVGRLEWRTEALLAVFPFPHSLEMTLALAPDALTIDTVLTAGADGPVPVAFGFHPYLGLPDRARSEWRLELPAMRRLLVDTRRIPTGAEESLGAGESPLAGRSLDDGFALERDGAVLAISGAGLRVSVELLEGYRYAQAYAPLGRDLVALEPMTAPSNALVSGRGLTVVAAGESFRASFRIRIGS